MPSVWYPIMWCSQMHREMNPKIIRKNWRMSKKTPIDWSVYFAIDDELEKIKHE